MSLAILCLPFASSATIQEPSDVIINTAKQVMTSMTANKEQIMADSDLMYDLVNDLVIIHFDFVSMSKWVLGRKHWNATSKEQHEEFIEEFKQLLIRTYAKTLLEYPDEELQYITTEKTPESPLVVVKMQINTDDEPFSIDYRMHLRNEQWKVVDVMVDGISLVAAYHGSFKSEIEKNGFASLLQKLRERNAK